MHFMISIFLHAEAWPIERLKPLNVGVMAKKGFCQVV